MSHSVVPANARPRVPLGGLRGEHCVWMRAGVVTYKLCDRDFDCEHCPLDAALRNEPLPTAPGHRRETQQSVEFLNTESDEIFAADGAEARLTGLPAVGSPWSASCSRASGDTRRTAIPSQEVAMKHARNRIKDGLLVAATLLVVVLCLPLIAAFAFVTRGVLLAAAIVAVVGGLAAYTVSPRFRAWLDLRTAPLIRYKGLRLAAGVAVHPSHSWARLEPDDVFVGADDLVQAVLGPVESVELPPAGRHVRQGEPLARLRHGERSVELRAPITGTVESGNPALAEQPGLVNEDPFNKGWLVMLRAESPRADRRRLFRGSDLRAWFQAEVDRLIGTVLADRALAPSLPDGGPVVEGLYRHIDDAAWQRLTDTFFAAPPVEH